MQDQWQAMHEVVKQTCNAATLQAINIRCNYIAVSRAVRHVTDDSGVQSVKKDILKEIDSCFAAS